MKNALFVAPEPNRLVLCKVHIQSHPLDQHPEQIAHPLDGEGLEPNVLSWKCHSGPYRGTL